MANQEYDDLETTNEEYSELTEADYYALKERLEKAEETIVKFKREKKSSNSNEDIITKSDLELIRFIDKNPEFEGKEEEIKKYLKKGLSIKDASKLISPNEEVINRKKTKETSITGGDFDLNQTTYTKEEIAELSQSEYNKVMDLYEAGKIRIK